MVDHRGWRSQSLLPRVATILIGAPVLIGILILGGGYLLAVVLLLVAIGAREFYRLAVAVGYHPSVVLIIGALIFPVLAGAHRWEAFPAATVAVVVAATALGLTSARRTGAPSAAAVDVLGALFVGALFAHLLLLREVAGFPATLTLLGIIWANDIGAYLVGVKWGRHKLAPAISPGKSVEGFAGGLVVAVAVAVVVAVRLEWPAARVGLIGLVVALVGVAGDLYKSTIKRAAGVKDSGAILPGHGGVLDRFDAVLFGVPVGYYLWRWLVL
jgi:phosphatidate cytidylyltransferase